MAIELFPLKGIVMDGVSLEFGMKKTAIDDLIGPSEVIRNRHYYLNGELAIDYTADERVEFIEMLGGIDGQLQPILYGIPVFISDAEAVYRLLKQRTGDDRRDAEQEYSIQFPQIGVGLFREICPRDILEMIAEMEADGIPTDNNPDLEADIRRANHWATIGLGAAGYYD